jgi:hypothetical protein
VVATYTNSAKFSNRRSRDSSSDGSIVASVRSSVLTWWLRNLTVLHVLQAYPQHARTRLCLSRQAVLQRLFESSHPRTAQHSTTQLQVVGKPATATVLRAKCAQTVMVLFDQTRQATLPLFNQG